MRGGLSFLDRVFFDVKYFETLLPDEKLALGAHEFAHMNQRHGRKRFWRIFAPALIPGTAIGLFVFFNFALFDLIYFFNDWGKIVSSLFVAVFFFLFVFIAGFYVNAKWLRQQETEFDLSAAKYVNGEAMVSALIEFHKLRPKKMTRLDRLLPKLYPTLEQRIRDIRIAEERKKNQGT